MLYRLGRLLAAITNVTTVIGGLAIALMMFHVTAAVAARYLFGTPLPGTITIVSYYYMLIAAFIPLAYAEQKEAHISVEVLTERLPAGLQRHLAGWGLLLSAAAFTVLTWRTWLEAVGKYADGASVVQGNTSIIVWPTYFVLPVGFGLMALVAVYKFLLYLTGARSGLDEHRARPDEIETAE